jgi:hypothetical protein
MVLGPVSLKPTNQAWGNIDEMFKRKEPGATEWKCSISALIGRLPGKLADVAAQHVWAPRNRYDKDFYWAVRPSS